MREVVPGGNSKSMTGRATYCGSPSVGWVCIRKPGAAFTSTIAAAGLADGLGDVGADEVDAGDVEADDARGGLGDLDVVRVRLQGPVDRRAAGRHVAGQGELDPDAARPGSNRGPGPAPRRSASAASSRAIRVSTFSWPMPRRGSALAVSTSSRTVCSPSPDDRRGDAFGDGRQATADDQHAVVVAGDVGLDDDVARRGSRAARPAKRGPDRLFRTGGRGATPRPWLPSSGLTTHGKPSFFAAATASSSVPTTSERGTGRPAESRSRLVRLLSDAMSTAMADVREVIVARIRCWWTPWPSWTRRVPVEPDVRDVAAHGLVDEGLGGRPEGLPLGQPDEPLQLGQRESNSR